MNSVMGFVKEDITLANSSLSSSSSPSSSSSFLNKPFIPPQPSLQKAQKHGIPGVDKRVFNKLPITYFQFVFIVIAALVGTMVLLFAPSKLQRNASRLFSLTSGLSQKDQTGWRLPIYEDYKALLEKTTCQIEKLDITEITGDILQNLEGKPPQLISLQNKLQSWTDSNLWSLDNFRKNFGNMRVNYEEQAPHRGMLSGKMLLEEALSRFLDTPYERETRFAPLF